MTQVPYKTEIICVVAFGGDEADTVGKSVES